MCLYRSVVLYTLLPAVKQSVWTHFYNTENRKWQKSENKTCCWCFTLKLGNSYNDVKPYENNNKVPSNAVILLTEMNSSPKTTTYKNTNLSHDNFKNVYIFIVPTFSEYKSIQATTLAFNRVTTQWSICVFFCLLSGSLPAKCGLRMNRAAEPQVCAPNKC